MEYEYTKIFIHVVIVLKSVLVGLYVYQQNNLTASSILAGCVVLALCSWYIKEESKAVVNDQLVIILKTLLVGYVTGYHFGTSDTGNSLQELKNFWEHAF